MSEIPHCILKIQFKFFNYAVLWRHQKNRTKCYALMQNMCEKYTFMLIPHCAILCIALQAAIVAHALRMRTL